MNSTEDVFADELKKRTEEAQAVIERFLPKAEGPAATVIEAMNYSVEAGGKRLRPVFLMEVAKMYGAEKALYEPFMAALEMIHTYSLIHDEPALSMPAMILSGCGAARRLCRCSAGMRAFTAWSADSARIL